MAEDSLSSQKHNEAMPAQGGHFLGGPNQETCIVPTRSGAGDRRTVIGREGPVFAGLEFGRFFDVPHRVYKKIN